MPYSTLAGEHRYCSCFVGKEHNSIMCGHGSRHKRRAVPRSPSFTSLSHPILFILSLILVVRLLPAHPHPILHHLVYNSLQSSPLPARSSRFFIQSPTIQHAHHFSLHRFAAPLCCYPSRRCCSTWSNMLHGPTARSVNSHHRTVLAMRLWSCLPSGRFTWDSHRHRNPRCLWTSSHLGAGLQHRRPILLGCYRLWRL